MTPMDYYREDYISSLGNHKISKRLDFHHQRLATTVSFEARSGLYNPFISNIREKSNVFYTLLELALDKKRLESRST